MNAPPAVAGLARALADWIASFDGPPPLLEAMAAACDGGAPWVGAIAATAARRTGWPETEALAWGLCMGGSAGALEALRESLESESRGSPAADGPALPLLASDGLVAAAHEALAALEPTRLEVAFAALEATFGDGGPWRTVAGQAPWTALVPCALGPAAAEQPTGPWPAYAAAWTEAVDSGWYCDPALWQQPATAIATRTLFRAAAHVAATPSRPEATHARA
ncbi:MAG: hypothetical protein ABR559_03820 [Gemmatimonadota bacterium]